MRSMFAAAIVAVALAAAGCSASMKDAAAALQKGDGRAAAKIYRELAARSDHDAEQALGDLYSKGTPDVDADAGEALEWYTKAAAGGLVESQRIVADKLGFASYSEMQTLQKRGFHAKADYGKALSFTPSDFVKICTSFEARFDSTNDAYTEHCLGRTVIWRGVVTALDSTYGARVQLYDAGHPIDQRIDSTSLAAAGVRAADVGKLVTFQGRIGKKGILTPDVDGVIWFELQERTFE